MSENTRGAAAKPFPTQPVAPLGIIPLRGCEALAGKINDYLMLWQGEAAEGEDESLRSYPSYGHDDFLLSAKCPRFGTGEAKGMISTSVRGIDLYILVDIGAYQEEYPLYGRNVPMTPDEHFADLKRIIAAVGGKAHRLNVIMPLLYQSRQHRRTSRESLDCALALQELERMGVVNLITFDAHDPRVQNAVPLMGFENVMPPYQMLKALLREEKDLKLDKDHMMIISPDEGAIGRNIFYSTVLGLSMGIFYKRRDYTRLENGRNPIIAHEYLGEDVEGMDVFVADDMISSGESMLDLARELKARKAGRIFAAATFPFFTEGIDAFRKAYEEGTITRVISTNLTYRTPELLAEPWFVEADLSKYIAFIIATLNHDRSLSQLLNPWGRIKGLLEHYRNEQAQSGIRLV